MWTRILLMPWWARALIAGGLDAVLMAVNYCADWLFSALHQDSSSTLMQDAISIVIFGLLVAVLTRNSHKAYTRALAGLDPAQRSEALDASFRGLVPADAATREAAIRVTRRRVVVAGFWRVLWLVLSCMGIAALVLEMTRATGREGPDPDDWISLALSSAATLMSWNVSIRAKRYLQILDCTRELHPKSAGDAH